MNAHKVRGLPPLRHQRLGKVFELLHQVRPVVRHRVGGVMAKAWQRMHSKAARTQLGEQVVVGSGWKAVGVGKNQKGA